MKIINKLIILLMPTLLSVGFTSCNDDDDPADENTPKFVLEQESIRVKIGSENKVTVNVEQGGGEYNAFCLDEDMAKVEVTNDVITVEGVANGQTTLIVSDRYSRYRKLPVAIYTTDVLELSDKELDLIAPLGSTKTITANVTLGNGGYNAQSDHSAVSVSITEEGDIEMNATSKKSDYTATVTITDQSGLSANIVVTVKASLEPFTADELEDITAYNSRRYFYNNANTFLSYYIPLNEVLGNGKQRYGWDYWSFYYLFIDFTGDKSVGVKNEAEFTYNKWSSVTTESITLEIIKNDGTNIWGIFSYINDEEEKLYTGYFCDAVNPQ